MSNRSTFFLAAASVAVMALGFAGAASAQDTGLYGSVSVGSTSVDADNGYTLSPSGTVIDIRLGDAFPVSDFSVGVEAGVSYSNAKASNKQMSCDVANCGYDEYRYETDKATWSGSLGLRVSYDLGPVRASLLGGARVAELSREVKYDSAGVFPTYQYDETSMAFGPYWGFGASYKVSDWSVGVDYERSNLVRTRSCGYTDGFNTETVTFRVVKEF